MKRIYLLLAGLVLVGAAFGQAPAPQFTKFPGLEDGIIHQPTKAPDANLHGVQTTKFDGWFDPVFDQAFNRDFKTSGTKQKITYGTEPIFPDSTVISSDKNGNYAVDLFSMGSILDPTSSFLYTLPSGDPSAGSEGAVITKNDPYTLDSVMVDAWYIKKKVANVKDTLYTWISWQKPTDNDVFVKRETNKFWGAPMNTWRDSLLSIRIDTLTPGKNGHVLKPKALPANIRLVKYVLLDTDTSLIGSTGARTVKRIRIKITPDPIVIPAGNLVACYLAYIPQAGSYVAGDCIFPYSSPKKPQTANGIGLRMWAEKTDSTGLHDIFVDPSSKYTGGLLFPINDRYPTVTGPKKYFLRGYLHYGPAINFHIFGNSSVGINELSANGNFSLGQNVPNPFTGETTISYQLKTNSKNASLVIYNVTGIKVFEHTESNIAAGKYSVDVNADNLSSGIYFYSLIVDGSQVTKKMIIAE